MDEEAAAESVWDCCAVRVRVRVAAESTCCITQGDTQRIHHSNCLILLSALLRRCPLLQPAHDRPLPLRPVPATESFSTSFPLESYCTRSPHHVQSGAAETIAHGRPQRVCSLHHTFHTVGHTDSTQRARLQHVPQPSQVAVPTPHHRHHTAFSACCRARLALHSRPTAETDATAG